jgi:hypothetical protein
MLPPARQVRKAVCPSDPATPVERVQRASYALSMFSSPNAVGTWSWAQRTHGCLRRRDRIELARQAVLARLERIPRRWRKSLLDESRPPRLPDPPDSDLARAAEAHLHDTSHPGLYAHCMRTWLFATLFADRDRLEHDEELLYLACVLHDLGLTDAHDRRDPSAECFAVEGARAAHRLVCADGESEDRARLVAEAITLHLNITVPARLGAEAHLLHRGAWLDVAGRSAHRLPPDTLRAIVRCWPRDQLAESLLAANAAQASARPRSRAAFLQGLPGVARVIAANPLDQSA